MTSELTVLGVVTALLLSGTVAFGAVPDVAAGNAADSHEISECTVIDEPGTYTLTNNITNESTETCLDVRDSDVAIDGNGYTVDGVDGNGTGILAVTTNNVTVRDITVTGFETGVTVASDAEASIVDSRIEANAYGVEAASFANVTIAGSVVANNEGSGVTNDESSVTVLDSRVVDNGGSGIAAATAGDLTVRESLVAGNTAGIDASDGDLVSENNTVRDNSEVGISALHQFESTNDVVTGNGAGVRMGDSATITGAEVSNNSGSGLMVMLDRSSAADVTVSDSRIVDNGGDGVYVSPDTDDLEEHIVVTDSTIADNDRLGVNNSATVVVDALDNDWGSDDGPSSADDPDAPFEDPVTGHLADGSGDEISEHPERPGVSNVHFTTEPPEDDEDDESKDDEDDESEDDEDDESDEGEDDGAEDGDDRERPSDVAYQIDLAKGEVIENLGEDEDAFYGGLGQHRLLQATSVTADGDTTDRFQVPAEMVTTSMDGCHISYDAIEYGEATGEATVTVAHDEDSACGEVTVTLAAYELPRGTTDFVYDRADEQELRDYETVTLAPGETTTVTIDVHDSDG